MGTVMRALGQDPSDAILEEMVKGVGKSKCFKMNFCTIFSEIHAKDTDGNGVIDWQEFLQIMINFNLESGKSHSKIF